MEANCLLADANGFKDSFIQAQKENEELFTAAEKEGKAEEKGEEKKEEKAE